MRFGSVFLSPDQQQIDRQQREFRSANRNFEPVRPEPARDAAKKTLTIIPAHTSIIAIPAISRAIRA